MIFEKCSQVSGKCMWHCKNDAIQMLINIYKILNIYQMNALDVYEKSTMFMKKVDMKHVFERNVNHCFKNASHVLRILNMYKNVLDVY